MTDAARLTPLGVMVLGLLREADMHPYEMMRLMRQRRADRLVPIQNGTFYHTVVRLERAGLISAVGTDREGNRPERTTYAVTDAGIEIVRDWVRRELPRTDRRAEFRVALAEAHNLARAEVTALLGLRRDDLAAQVAELARRLTEVAELGVPHQFVVEVERDRILLEADLAWLDDLLRRLADGSLPWGIDEVPAEFRRSIREAQNA